MKESLVRYQQCQNMDRLIQLEHLMWVEAHLLVEQASMFSPVFVQSMQKCPFKEFLQFCILLFCSCPLVTATHHVNVPKLQEQTIWELTFTHRN